MILFHFMENLTSGFLDLADGVRRWLFGALALAVIAVMVCLGPSTTRRREAAGILVVAVLLVMSAPPSAAAQTALAELQVEAYPWSPMAAALGDGPATEASVRVLRSSAVIPFVYRSGRTLVASSLSGSWVGVKVRPLDPARDEPLKALYDFDLNLMAVQQVSERWRLALVVSPGIASDLRKLAADHWTLQGAALATRQASPSLEWGFGVSATNAFGAFGVVPVASLAWVGSRWEHDPERPAAGRVDLPHGDRVAFACLTSMHPECSRSRLGRGSIRRRHAHDHRFDRDSAFGNRTGCRPLSRSFSIHKTDTNTRWHRSAGKD